MATVGPQPRQSENTLEELENVPLFMRSLPENSSDDATISALQSLAHEGTPDEVAENFKDLGNEYFRGKRWSEARSFYTQGIDAKPTNQKLVENLLCNRAACNLELQNYGSVLRDCSKAISFNSRSSKAFYRSALALYSLRRLEECIDCSKRCLEFDPSNTSVTAILNRANAAKALKDNEENKQRERLEKDAILQRKLRQAYRDRHIIVLNDAEADTLTQVPHFLDEHPSTLVFPVFFLYPQHATSDLISQYDERDTFTSHIITMFPSTSDDQERRPTWDQQGEYLAQNLGVYVITHQRRILKVGRKMNLRDVFKASEGNDKKDGLELKNGCLSFIVLPKGNVEQTWIQHFKDTR